MKGKRVEKVGRERGVRGTRSGGGSHFSELGRVGKVCTSKIIFTLVYFSLMSSHVPIVNETLQSTIQSQREGKWSKGGERE